MTKDGELEFNGYNTCLGHKTNIFKGLRSSESMGYKSARYSEV